MQVSRKIGWRAHPSEPAVTEALVQLQLKCLQ